MPREMKWFLCILVVEHALVTLYTTFYMNVTVKGGLVVANQWATRSLDLNPLDVYLRGHLKTTIYSTK